jgi:hypothetical protein
MKNITAIVVSAVISFSAAWFAASYYQTHQLSRAQATASSSDDSQQASNPSDAQQVKPLKTTGEPRTSETHRNASQALAKLSKLKPLPGPGRNIITRQIIHQFENLVDYGFDSLQPIKEFLEKYEDVDYPSGQARVPDLQSDNAPADDGMTPSWVRPQLRTDSILPPSLRLGLIDVLKNISGPDAQKILADLLSTTGRGIEVSYAARALQEMAPDQYRDMAVNVAKDLLTSPPKIERPGRLDEHSRTYLLEVLAMYHDTSFANAAQTTLVGYDGRLDRNALDYINKTMKEQAIPAIVQAYKDYRITNQWEKAALVNASLSYVGSYPQANVIFSDLVTNSSLPVSMRTMAIQNIATQNRAQAQDASAMQASTQQLLQLFEEARQSAKEETLARALEDGIKLMQERIVKSPVSNDQ